MTEKSRFFTQKKEVIITRESICTGLGLAGGAIASLFGGWDAALSTLVLFMATDYLMGLIVAGVFHNSGKSESGALESRAGWKGLCRKGITLFIVLIACRLDLMLGVSFVRDAAVIGFCANEALSILENAGLMGVKMPAAVEKAIEVLRKNAEK